MVENGLAGLNGSSVEHGLGAGEDKVEHSVSSAWSHFRMACVFIVLFRPPDNEEHASDIVLNVYFEVQHICREGIDTEVGS